MHKIKITPYYSACARSVLTTNVLQFGTSWSFLLFCHPQPLVVMSDRTELIEATSLQCSGSDPTKYNRATCEDLLKFAAEDQLGNNIELEKYPETDKDMIAFKNAISIRVLNREESPRTVGKTVVDIYTKEYKNYADKSSGNGDTTKALVHRSNPGPTGRNYQFTSKQGIVWNMHENIGVQLLAIGTGGGNMGLGSDHCQNVHMTSNSVEKVASALGASLGFSYNQEENITIPPGKKVLVAFTTAIVEYHLGYKLEFRLPKMQTVTVKYKKPCLGCLCRFTNFANISYKAMVRNLPEYREDGAYVYFTQEGVLSWFGESCQVNKNEASL